MENTINQRVKKIVYELCEGSQTSLSIKSGVPQGTISGVIQEKQKLRKEGADKILRSIPCVSAQWLLFGEGEMIVKDNMMSNNVEYQSDEKVIERIYGIMKRYSINSKTKLAEYLNISDQTLGQYLNRKMNISIWLIESLLKAFPDISFMWLYCGIGNMEYGRDSLVGIDDKFDYNENNEETDTISQPLYDIDFIGGFTDTFDSTENVDGKVCVPGYDNVTCWCRLSGDSMSPIIKNGDMIALKMTNVDEIQYGLTYAVVMENIRTVKKLRKSQNEGMLRFVPTNPEYDEQEFPIKSIKVIYQVVGVISRL